MDVDANVASLSTPQFSGTLTDAEKKKLMDENRCFYCKGTGHCARQCFKKQAMRTNSRNSGGNWNRSQSSYLRNQSTYTCNPAITARVASVETTNEAPPAPRNPSPGPIQTQITDHFKMLSQDERSQVFDEIASQMDF
jgi:hypothetical protein